MTTLGSYPSHRYSRSWINQRLFNRIPPWSQARRSAVSIGQQFMNPMALEVQETYQQLAKARYDQFLSTADISQLDTLYRCDILPEMEFSYTEDSNGNRVYTPPSVYGTLNGTEYQLTQAEENDIKTLITDNLPSRIEDAETSYNYTAVIPEVTIENLASTSPEELNIYGHLYITIKNNSTWEQRTTRNIYYPKIYITGTTRKDTTTTEAIPIRYNGTFKTINEWKEVTGVFVSYLDPTATISIEVFPNNRESYLDTQNICVLPDGTEKFQFTRLNTRSFGSTFLAEAFVLADLDLVRAGLDDKDPYYEIELLDSSSQNLTALDYVHRPYSRFIYLITSTKFIVYDVNLPFPDIVGLDSESDDARIDLSSEQWILARGQTAKIQTQNQDISNVPWRVRWHVIDPNDTEWYMGLDGSLWSTSTNAWIENNKLSDTLWDNQIVEFTVSIAGRYLVRLEAEYYDEINNTTSTKYTNFIFFLPSIEPEVEFTLPTDLQGSTAINLDSDNNIWLTKSGVARKLDLFFDYFLVDYERGRVYTKENYSSIRITV